jgi:hypothetical protein
MSGGQHVTGLYVFVQGLGFQDSSAEPIEEWRGLEQDECCDLKPTSASISEFIYLTMLQTDQII